MQSNLYAQESSLEKKKVPVSIVSVLSQSYARPVIASGTARPVSEQTLAFKVSGIVAKVLVKEGTFVKKGMLLAILELDEIDAQVAKARAVVKDAQRKLTRSSKLRAQELISDELNAQAIIAVEVAQADLDIAEFNRKYTEIKAPADGRVLTRHIEPHELIQKGQPSFVFEDSTQGWNIRLSVSDVDVVKLKLGDSAKMMFDAFPDEAFYGVVSEISGRADVLSYTFDVAVKMDHPPTLYSGLIAHTRIVPSQKKTLTPLPLSALLDANGKNSHVYVIDSAGHAQRRAIELAYIDSQYAMVSAGLSDGEKVVTQGGPYILNGNDIKIVNESPAISLQAKAK